MSENTPKKITNEDQSQSPSLYTFNNEIFVNDNNDTSDLNDDNDIDNDDDDEEMILKIDDNTYEETKYLLSNDLIQHINDQPLTFDYNMNVFETEKPSPQQSLEYYQNPDNIAEIQGEEKDVQVKKHKPLPRVTSHPLQGQMNNYYNPPHFNTLFSMNDKPGWICSNCRNFNFEMRTQCNKCRQSQLGNNDHITNVSPDPKMQIPINPYIGSPINGNGNGNIISNGNDNGNIISNGNGNGNGNIIINGYGNIISNGNGNIMSNGNGNGISNVYNNNYSPKNYNISPNMSPPKYSHSYSPKGKKGDDKKKAKYVEREGDWICFKCKNVNFAFRTNCNRCNVNKVDNQTYMQMYMNMTNIPQTNKPNNPYIDGGNIKTLQGINGQMNPNVNMGMGGTIYNQNTMSPKNTHSNNNNITIIPNLSMKNGKDK